MNSLTRNMGTPQIRCRSITGGRDVAPFLYEANLLGEWVAINYQFAAWLVEDMRIKHEAEQCKSLTVGTVTGEETSSGLPVTTGKSSKSYSDVKAMSMTVCSQLSNSATNSQGLKNDYQ
jgi:hypothetical protein